MARLDPKESFEALKTNTIESIKSSFPQEGDRHVLEVEDVEIDDKQSSGDYTSQKKAKMGGRTWGVPVRATMVLKDKKTGKVLDRKRQKIATLPKVTNRYSYIVDGSEFQVDNQWRLKPGVYTKVKQNGELDSFFNIKGRPLHVGFDPKARKFQVQHGGAKPPLYPIMKAMGISDDTLERQWGKDILEANKVDGRGRPVKTEKVAIDFAKRLDPKAEVENYEQAATVIQQNFEASELSPEVTERTLGKKIDRINADAMLRSSGRLLGVARGTEKPDTRDSLMFKDLNGIEDFVGERITGHQHVISRRIGNNLDRRDTIKEIVSPDTFNRPIKEFFGKVSLANTPQQTNPLRIISGQMKTTIAGEGGVADANRITEEAKLVDPSHFAVLDPLHTPEGASTGVSLQMAIGARKQGKKAVVPLINAKTGKREMVDTSRVHDSTVAMPDSVQKVGGKYVPKKGSTVLASTPGNEMRPVKMKDVQYVVPKSSQMFSLATNMVPFISSDSPNRATMAGRHMEQAIPLEDGETPLVQSALGDKTFDEIVGSFSSHHAPVGGKVVKVGKDSITVQGADRKKVEVPIYNNYPLNEKKGFMHSTPTVKKGDTVKKGQLLADTNYTKDGVYAPGKNLRVGYTPWKGLNFEDGVVISETAAQKLTSAHMHKKGLSTRDASLDGKRKYRAYYPDRLQKEQFDKLDDDGIVQVGQKVKPGDTLVAALADQQLTTEQQKLRLLHKSLVKPKKDKAITWEEDFEGEVVAVNRQGKKVEVHVKTREPMEVGDKLVGRHGNKGIVTGILPDEEMPQTKSGKPMEVLMNPIGTPGRMNVGQVLETAASKVARKSGKPFKVENFSQDDNLAFVEGELKKAGVTDKEDLVDPKTGKTVPGIQTGHQYILKMEHQVGKKVAARSRDAYDHNLVPRGGGKHGAQALGSLGVYAMLAHGAKANLREMQVTKSDKSQGGDKDELWGALQAGELLPPPKTTFAYEKFNGYLNALGVDTKKDGNSLNLVPLTDKQVLDMSEGELKDPGRTLKMRTLKPEKGGLFDEKVTGGMDGKKWSHIKLKEPMPNPLFEKAVMSLAGVRGPQFGKLIEGESGVMPDGTVVDKPGVKGATYGPKAVGALLDNIDVEKDLKQEETRIKGLKGQAQNESRRKIKYLRNLKKLGMSPRDAYMVQNVPVMPPSMRPISVMEDGSLQTDDLNELYKGLGIVNKKMGEFPKGTPESLKAPVAAGTYDHLKALTGIGGTLNSKHPGILQSLAGKEGPKTGFVQDTLIKRKQDMTARSTIVPEPSLSLDEAAIPRKAAKEMYKPFVVRELRRTAGASPLQAQKMIEADDPLAKKALERVVQDRPLILKRDPVLHKYGIQAFKPKLTEGKAIKIHPLVCSGYNADFDGDTMSAFVPIEKDAIKEAEGMFPSKNLFSPASQQVMYTPSHEQQVGLFMATQVGKKTNLKFKDQAALEKAHNAGEVKLTDVVSVGGVKTTLGRVRVDKALPKQLQGGEVLKDLRFQLTKKKQGELFQKAAESDPKSYPKMADSLKDIGNQTASTEGFSFGLEDFKTHKDVRDPILRQAASKAVKLDPNKEKDAQKIVDIYGDAMEEIEAGVKTKAKKQKTQLDRLEVAAGIKGNGYRQLTAAPVLFVDGSGKVVPNPVKKSFSEGLDTASYWSATSGGRKGIVQKVQSVSEPGYLTKMMTNSVIDTVVDEDDCGTARGINLSVDEPDVVGRYTTADVNLGRGKKIPAGTMLTPDVITKIKNNKSTAKVVVRSPMRCSHGKGVCKKCMGIDETGHEPDKGTNVGVMAAQALGERGTQLAMKAFHCNHSKTIVSVCPGRGTNPIMISMEDLFDLAPSTSEVDEDGEYKALTQEDGWLMADGDGWTLLTQVRRHAPTRPMVMVSDQSAVTICQDNHPIAVRENLVRCGECGNHRLKKPSPAASIKNGKHYCSACGHYQLPPEEKVGDELGFLPPVELEPKRWYGERRLIPENALHPLHLKKLDLDPYFVGAYIAEGWVGYRWTNPRNRKKKPYSIGLKQNPGPVRDRILERVHDEWRVRGRAPTIEIHSLKLGRRFESLFGCYSWNKALPPDFIHYDRDWLADFLCGLIDGDGTSKSDTDGADRIAIDTTSFELAQQVVIICTRLGIISNLLATTHRELTRHQGFRVVLRITGWAKGLLASSIKVSSVEKCSPAQEVSVSGQHLISNIRSVYYTDEFVYDVTTSSSTFVAGGLLNHNSGGVYEGKEAKSLTSGGLNRATELLYLKKKVKGSATLATSSGKIRRIKKDPAGGYRVKIGDTEDYIPADRARLSNVRVGQAVKKGDPLTKGPVNPHELLPLVGMSKTQGHLAGELHGIYGKYGIRRRNSEAMVRALSGVTKVEDPGDNPDLLPGDFASTTQVYDWNKKHKKGQPVKHAPVLRGVKQIPLDVQEDWMARLNHEHLRSTIIEASQQGWSSDLHGLNPIPPLIHGVEFGKGTKDKPWRY